MFSVSHTWGTEPHERALSFPCDRIIPTPVDTLFRGISIQASPQMIFRWLCQMRVAPYSYDWIDNFGRRSPQELTPGLDNLEIGQEVMRIFELVEFVRDQHITIRIKQGTFAQKMFGDSVVSYCIIANPERPCRLLVKVVTGWTPWVIGWLSRRFLPWGDLVMMRRQLLNFRKLAEQTFNQSAV
jgi:hypothetical protein